MEIKEQKKEIRKSIRELKKSIPQEDIYALSISIEEKIIGLPEILEAQTILLYYSLPDEVSTELLLQKLSNRREGVKRIILPVVDEDSLILKEYIPSKITQGYQNIPDPSGDDCIDPAEIELAIVPGVAFDSKCNRMGRGKGFYDRLIPSLQCKLIGLGFGFQVIDSIPCDHFDKPLDMVVTENEIYVK